MAGIIAVPLWIVGATYSLDGLIRAAQGFVFWLTSTIGLPPVALPPIRSLWIYLLMAGLIGLIFSRIEIGQWHRFRKSGWYIGLGALIVWAVTNAVDLGSTFAGVTAPGPVFFPLQAWVNTNALPALTWSIIVTYLPEALLLFAIRRW